MQSFFVKCLALFGDGKLIAAERRKLLEPNQLSVKYAEKGICGTSCVFQGASTQKNGK